ncbi:MAG: ABC transporter substrate-binding protein, partial [Pyrobaculum sp.]
VAVKAAAADPTLSMVRWIGTDGIAMSKAMASEVGKEMAAAKLLGTIAGPDPNDPSFQKFKQEYMAKYNREPVAYDPYAYDAAMLLATIVCQLGTTDPEKVRAALEQWGRDGKYTGVTGKVYLNENGDRAFPNYLIWGVVVEGGSVKYIDAGYYYGAERKLNKYPQGEALFK